MTDILQQGAALLPDEQSAPIQQDSNTQALPVFQQKVLLLLSTDYRGVVSTHGIALLPLGMSEEEGSDIVEGILYHLTGTDYNDNDGDDYWDYYSDVWPKLKEHGIINITASQKFYKVWE